MTRRSSRTNSWTRLSVAPLLTIIVRGTRFSSGSAACGGGAWPFFLFGCADCFFGSSLVGAAGRSGCACVRDFFLRPPLRGIVQLLCRLQAAGLLCGSLDVGRALAPIRCSNAAVRVTTELVIRAQRRRAEANLLASPATKRPRITGAHLSSKAVWGSAETASTGRYTFGSMEPLAVCKDTRNGG